MVRLVFRPYTQLRRSICTSESLRTSTRVSPGFVLARHRSPSFGSQRVRSRFVRSTRRTGTNPRRLATPNAQGLRSLYSRRDHPSRNTLSGAVSLSLRLASFVTDSTTRAHVRLLGPCFKTGRVGPDYYSPLWASSCSVRKPSTRRYTGHDRTALSGDGRAQKPGGRNRPSQSANDSPRVTGIQSVAESYLAPH